MTLNDKSLLPYLMVWVDVPSCPVLRAWCAVTLAWIAWRRHQHSWSVVLPRWSRPASCRRHRVGHAPFHAGTCAGRASWYSGVHSTHSGSSVAWYQGAVARPAVGQLEAAWGGVEGHLVGERKTKSWKYTQSNLVRWMPITIGYTTKMYPEVSTIESCHTCIDW